MNGGSERIKEIGLEVDLKRNAKTFRRICTFVKCRLKNFKFFSMKKFLTSPNGAIRLTIVGKINLPSVKVKKTKPKSKFVPYSSGYRLDEVWPK